MTTDDLTERIRDEIAGHPIGSGYYQTAVGIDEAADIAATVMSVVTPVLAEVYDEGYADGQHDAHEHRPGRKSTHPYRQEQTNE